MKKTGNKLKENLNQKDFIAKGQCVMRLLMTKLEMINVELSVKLKRDVIPVSYTHLTLPTKA